ncbi:hypothetical protein [Bdellovibrio sp. BCCA]|uniref:hypothetical protein n=1 Tax=Bdellovibrio sp. BCCA TaxID=3136281 RepID=UPI0030F020E7
MELKRKKLSTEIEHDYKMLIAGRERVLPTVVFTISPFDKGRTISATEYKRLYAIVCKEILSDITKPLLYEELELLRRYFQVTQSEIANALEVDESTVSKWRKQHGVLESRNSRVLKEFFISKLPSKNVVIMIDGQFYELSSKADLMASISEVIVKAVVLEEEKGEEYRSARHR